MLKKIIFFLVVVVILFGFYQLTSKRPTNTPVVNDQKSDILLFVGNGCPHCKNVEDFINSNNINARLAINQKEVYYNQENQKLLSDTVKNCPNIDSVNGIGVPLAYIKESNSCLQGDAPIIDYLKSKTGLK